MEISYELNCPTPLTQFLEPYIHKVCVAKNKLLFFFESYLKAQYKKRVLSFLNEMKCPKAFSIKIESIVELLLFVMTKEYWL